ncbi:MAG: hypothetical protein LRY68_11520 [Sulfurospirillum sp.]|nr:hypothetical protein [Sulfurospirillum sp.]
MKIANVLVAASLVAFVSGCASKDKEVFNMPATYWYEEIAKEIKKPRFGESRFTLYVFGQ